MKNYRNTLLHATIIITVIMGAFSCENNPKDTKTIAEDRNEEKFDNKDKEKDAQFLVDAAEISMENVRLGKLAQQKGTMNHVTELGQAMETTHSKAHAELTALAKSKNVSLPASQTKTGNDSHEKLMEKSGNDFGKAYSDKMVSRQEDAIKLYEKAASDSQDPEIRKWASEKLPTLRAHLDQAKKCKEACDKA